MLSDEPRLRRVKDREGWASRYARISDWKRRLPTTDLRPGKSSSKEEKTRSFGDYIVIDSAGVKEGTVLRVPGLRATVQVAPDPIFTREGKDLRVVVPVPLKVALQGGEVAAPTLKGGQVKFKVAAETQNGTKIRLRGLGLPDPKGGLAGDMYAEVRVQLPVPMDEKTRKWAAEQP